MNVAVFPSLTWREVPSRHLACPAAQLDLDRTLPSGQTFRWRRTEGGAWLGVVGGHVVRLTPAEAGLAVQSVPEWPVAAARDYFRLADDLTAIQARLLADPVVAPLVPRQPGLRLLRQAPAETLFTFLCTAANNIPRITRGIEVLARELGEPIAEVDAVRYHAFPTAERLADCDVALMREQTRLGWRPERLAAAARRLLERDPGWLETLRGATLAEARAALLHLPGVGLKIADCVCLFALDQDSAVPVDTHIWQAIVRHYRPDWHGLSLTPARYQAAADTLRARHGNLAGWAQQYLFLGELAPGRADSRAATEP